MEWMNRGGEPQAANQPAQSGATTKAKKSGSSMNVIAVVLVFAVLVVLVGIGIVLSGGGTSTPSAEGKYVKGDQLQAVFLNGGQVYFGDIEDLNDKHIRMTNIYYLRVNQTVQPNQTNADGSPATQNDISLVKLGCELHGPQDEMLINRSQVIFWENLKDDGQVANAVKEYKQNNPNGQDCNAQQNTNTGNNNNNTGTGTDNQ